MSIKLPVDIAPNSKHYVEKKEDKEVKDGDKPKPKSTRAKRTRTSNGGQSKRKRTKDTGGDEA